MLGPGKKLQRLKTSVNSGAVSQRRSSTSIRRVQGMAPPKARAPAYRKPR